MHVARLFNGKYVYYKNEEKEAILTFNKCLHLLCYNTLLHP